MKGILILISLLLISGCDSDPATTATGGSVEVVIDHSDRHDVPAVEEEEEEEAVE